MTVFLKEIRNLFNMNLIWKAQVPRYRLNRFTRHASYYVITITLLSCHYNHLVTKNNIITNNNYIMIFISLINQLAEMAIPLVSRNN